MCKSHCLIMKYLCIISLCVYVSVCVVSTHEDASVCNHECKCKTIAVFWWLSPSLPWDRASGWTTRLSKFLPGQLATAFSGSPSLPLNWDRYLQLCNPWSHACTSVPLIHWATFQSPTHYLRKFWRPSFQYVSFWHPGRFHSKITLY